MAAEGAIPVPDRGTQAAGAMPREATPREAMAPRDGASTGPMTAAVPLVVDLDGTVVATDLLAESLFILAKRRPLTLLRAPGWLLGGLAHFKRRVAQAAVPDVWTLPYNRDVLAYLDEEKRRGRPLILATGADEAVARAVADRLGCFDAVLASDGTVNLRGAAKRDRLVAEFGVGGFDYAGNGNADRPVWRAARQAILVHPAAALRRREEKELRIERVFEREGSAAAIHARALRVTHWFKNLLVLVPLLADCQLLDSASLARGFLAFVAFSLCASSVYLLNDLLDLPEDRRHPHKSKRVLASGQLTTGRALVLVPLLLLGAAGVAAALPPAFMAVLACYFLLMLAYCLKLRDIAFLDAGTLGAGYALRVLGGAAAASLAVSTWLLAFSFLFFSGLALLKRYADLVAMRTVKGEAVHVHAYVARDSGRLAALGCGTSYSALLLVACYIALGNLQGRHELIWVVLALLLFWVTHMWLMAWRGCIAEDPVIFALTDRTSRVLGILSAITVLAAAA